MTICHTTTVSKYPIITFHALILRISYRDTQPQVNKQLNFLLPFMGFGFNYTWLSLHGQLTFSEVPIQFPEYPLTFPIRDWPRRVSVY